MKTVKTKYIRKLCKLRRVCVPWDIMHNFPRGVKHFSYCWDDTLQSIVFTYERESGPGILSMTAAGRMSLNLLLRHRLMFDGVDYVELSYEDHKILIRPHAKTCNQCGDNHHQDGDYCDLCKPDDFGLDDKESKFID